MNERLAKVEAIFHDALELPPEERDAFLQKACEQDDDLRREVAALLRAVGIADGWLSDADPGGAERPREPEGAGTIIGRYKLLEKIGEGGFGDVYMAEQSEPVRRRVALKIIKLGMDTRSVIARFEAERQALALMDHPNIAKVLDAGATDTGRPYFVMELVRGIAVTKFCDENQLSTSQRLELFAQVCSAIQHAHQKGIIHRDIKPTNVLVTSNDGVPHPMVIDFGVAKALNQRLTEKTLFTNFAQMIGTPAYMSPEQAEMSKLDVDTRSDIYSLGVLLYELLTGTTPFPEQRLRTAGYAEMQRIICEEEPERPSTRLTKSLGGRASSRATSGNRRLSQSKVQISKSKIDRDLDSIVMKCLEKDRTRRYETASALAADLRRFLNHESVHARPTSGAARVWRWCRRKPMLAATLVLLLLVAIGSPIAALRINQERRRAEINAATANAAVTRLEIEKAEQLFDADNSSAALAYLARILRREPTNRVVAERILWALSHRSFSVPALAFQHSGLVNAGSFSPDGTRVATASQDTTARVWDSFSGAPVTGPLPHQGPVSTLRFSADGRKLITGSSDSTARVWDANSGQALTPPLQHSGAVISVDFSAGGRLVATGSQDGMARIWHADTGQPATAPLPHSNVVNIVRFSPDGRWLLTGSGYFAYVWDVETGRPENPVLNLGNGVRSLKFSSDGTRILSAGANGFATVWDFATGKALRSFGPMRNAASAEFSPEGARVAAGGYAAYGQIWDLATGNSITPPLQHDGNVNSIRFSPDGKQVITASSDNTARVWDAESGRPLGEPLHHNGSIRFADFSPDGRRVLTVSSANAAFLWELRLGQPLPTELPHRIGVSLLAFAPDGHQAATVSWDKITRMWETPTGRFLTNTVVHARRYITSLRYSSDGQRILTASHYGLARVWDAHTAAELHPPLRHWESETSEPGKSIVDAAFSPDGTRIITASADNTARVWNGSNGMQLLTLLHGGKVNTAKFNSPGDRILTACNDGAARVWQADNGRPLLEMRHEAIVGSAAFSPNGLQIVTASEDKTAHRWDARSGEPIGSPMQHKDAVEVASFSPDGSKVVTRCGKAAYVWDLRRAGNTEPIALTHGGSVQSAVFSPDSLRVLTASLDHSARVWDADTGHPLSGRIHHRGPVNDAQFSPDGRWIITAEGNFHVDDHRALIFEVPTATLPIAPWLADLAEAVAGQRLAARDSSQAVPPERLLHIRQRLSRSTEQDTYILWAKWFLSEGLSRTISPVSQVTVREYIERRIQQNTLPSLEKATLLSPTNVTAIARLVLASLTNIFSGEPHKLALAEFQTRWAAQFSPDDADVWLAHGQICERSGKQDEARHAYNRFVELSRTHVSSNSIPAAVGLSTITRVLHKLNRLGEAASLNLAELGLPQRDPKMAPNLIDLSAFYNVRLEPSTPTLVSGANDTVQPSQRLGEVEFDVRGAIRLSSSNPLYSRLPFPRRVYGINVQQKCRRLHFLHFVYAPEKDGTQVGVYLLRYADNQQSEIPIRYAHEVRTWGQMDIQTSLANTNAAIVWRGTGAGSHPVRLFRATWDNPRADAPIKSIDFVSSVSQSAPVLVAITLEP